MVRRRLDSELVRRGLAPTRQHAQAAISAGRVRVAGAIADKPGRLVAPGDALHLVGAPPRYVSRGGEKLAAALDRFAVDVGGRHALDAGASTGGFTDCLLQRGAATVTAVDVGHGQLHERLRRDPRVRVVERTNIRTVAPADVDGPFAVVVADLSFISLRTVAAPLLRLAREDGDVVVLVKPQFEAGREEAARGRGVIRDPDVWRRALEDVGRTYAGAGASMMDLMVSPLRGADGNVEFLAHLRRDAGRDDNRCGDLVDQAVASAVARGEGPG